MSALQKAKTLIDQASKNGYIYSDDLGCYVQSAEDCIEAQKEWEIQVAGEERDEMDEGKKIDYSIASFWVTDASTNVFIPFNSAEELAELLKEREEV